jgi:hypothetical protein
MRPEVNSPPPLPRVTNSIGFKLITVRQSGRLGGSDEGGGINFFLPTNPPIGQALIVHRIGDVFGADGIVDAKGDTGREFQSGQDCSRITREGLL